MAMASLDDGIGAFETLRAITEGEIAVLQWLLEHAAVGDVGAYRAKAIDQLQARPCCDKCAGLLFQDDQIIKVGHEMLADALAVYPDGQVAGVLLWASGGEFAWLELHDTRTEGTAKRFPGTSDLRTWEQHGQSLAR
ncbi:MAG: hypothetical protein IPJ98_13800 [Bryobacterales bacterium]|nr:hypothetical protein [Bryobacterales bacterium]